MLKSIASRSTVLFDLYQKRKNLHRQEFVEKMLPKNGVGAELGVFRGDFSPLLFSLTQPAKLHLVDPWYLLTSHWHWGPGSRSTVDGLRSALRKMEPFLPSGKVEWHVMGSVEFLDSFPPETFDWIYIDSSHEYEHTCKELKAAVEKMKPGGVIAGDDWRPDPAHRHHGVFKAVNEFCAAEGYEIRYKSDADNQWACVRANEK